MPRGTKKTSKKKPSAKKPRKAAPKSKRNRVEYAKVPKQFEPIFSRAQEFVSDYFSKLKGDAREGTIETAGERYLLVRADSMSVDFFETVKDLYKGIGEDEALSVARNLLFDIAHAIGKADAKSFHKKMKLEDPVDKLSAGPIHFAYSGWAFVDIFPESKPTPDENYYLIYDHPFSFESASWIKAKKKSDCPVCIMNSGYSSGWCEESFGITLVAKEIMCKAAGDETCRFIMAPPSKIEGYIEKYLGERPKLKDRFGAYEIPGFFKRKQIEQDLRESEESFRLVFDNANDAIFWADPKTGLITNCNRAAERLLERARKEIIGSHQTSLHPPGKAKHFSRMFEEHMRKNGAVNEEAEIVTVDGKVKPVEISASITSVGDKQIIQGIFRDITERKQRDESIRNASIYMNAMPDALVVLNKNAEIVEYNKGALTLLGYNEDEKPTLYFEDAVPAKEQSRYREALDEVFTKGESQTIEGYIRRKDGSEVAVLISGSAIFDESDKVEKIVCVLKNITQLKIIQEELEAARNNMEQRVELRTAELKRSQQLYQALAEAAEDYIFIIGADMSVKYVNEFAANSLRLSKDDVIGKKLSALFPVEASERMQKAIGHVFTSGEAVSAENPLKFPGAEVWLHTHLVPLKNGNGKVSGVMGLARDVTKRREYEERLRLTQATMDHVGNAIFWMGPDARFVYVNDQACIQLGYDRAELLRMSVHDIDPHFPKQVWRKHWRDVKEKKSFTIESHHRRKDGAEFPVEVMVNYLEHEGREYNCAVVLDVTERRKAEEELSKLASVVKYSSELINLSTPDGAMIFLNDAGCEMLGVEPEGLKNINVADVIPENFKGVVEGELLPALMKGGVWEGDLQYKNLKSGKLTDVHAMTFTVKDPDTGKVLYLANASIDITERKKAIEELRKSEDRYKRLFENSPVALWEEDFSGIKRYVDRVLASGESDIEQYLVSNPKIAVAAAEVAAEIDVNQACLDLFGAKNKDELLAGRTKILSGASTPLIVGVLEAIAARKTFYRGEGGGLNLKGENLSLFMSFAVLPGHEDTYDRVLISLADITERKKAEEELRQSEARLRTAVESLPFDFFIIGPDGRYAMVNTPCTGNWGDIIGKHPDEVPIDEKTKAVWKENNQRAFSGEVVRGEVEMVVHGRTKYFYNIIAPIHDEGKIYGVLGVNLDITERKMADEALKESERRFQQVAESAEEWIWEVNEHGLYTYSNDVIEDILGYKPEELVGMMHFYDFFAPEVRKELKERAFKVFGDRERIREFVNVNVHKDGREVILETSGSPIIDRNGELVGYRGVDTDITERKRAEEALRSALKMKSEFMAMMSHELRTPLARIISSSHLVLHDPDVVLPEKRKVNLGNVLASSDTLLLMINNVLEMARLEGGSVPVYAQGCNLRQMVRTCISSCEGMTGEKDLQFVTNIDDSIEDIYTDKEKLGHILMNLICNGIRYSDGGTVEIIAKPSSKKGCVDVIVSDEGIGIPPERMAELFEPFKQLEEITKRRAGGIGLGLAIVKANLELIGGTIDVKSEVGKGSMFTITIPRKYLEEKTGDTL